MGNFSLNNTVPEPDRSMDELGYNNVPDCPATPRPQGQGQGLPHPMTDEVTDHSNTVPMGWPTPAGDFARRTY